MNTIPKETASGKMSTSFVSTTKESSRLESKRHLMANVSCTDITELVQISRFSTFIDGQAAVNSCITTALRSEFIFPPRIQSGPAVGLSEVFINFTNSPTTLATSTPLSRRRTRASTWAMLDRTKV